MKTSAIAFGVSVLLAAPCSAQRPVISGRAGDGFNGHARVSIGINAGVPVMRIASPRVAPVPRSGGPPNFGRAPVRVFTRPQSVRPVPVMRIGTGGGRMPVPTAPTSPRVISIRPTVFHHAHALNQFGRPFRGVRRVFVPSLCASPFAFQVQTRNFRFFHNQAACFSTPFVSPFAAPYFATALAAPVYLPGAATPPPPAAAEEPPRREYVLRLEQPLQPAEPPRAPKETLLQFKDGSMYGVTDYWLEGGRLHYVTNYGAKNSVAFEEIDLEKTVQLNWERGVEFALRPKPANR